MSRTCKYQLQRKGELYFKDINMHNQMDFMTNNILIREVKISNKREIEEFGLMTRKKKDITYLDREH